MLNIKNLFTNRNIMARAFILLGVVVIAVYAFKGYRSYQQWQHIKEHGVDRGVASITAIRPWMTMRYVSVAYAVPQEYIFAELNIPYNHRNSNDTLGHLARIYQDKSKSNSRKELLISVKVGEIIQAYRKNPVITGLKDIRPWMTIQYISNSTGVPVDYLFTQLAIESGNNNQFKPLEYLAKEVNFPEKKRGLIDAVKISLSRYKDKK